MNMPEAKTIQVSVIIVSFNNLDLLEQCLTSLYFYTKDIVFEVIVVDNNSTSGNPEDITSKLQNIRLLKNNTNRGFAAANNQGINIARGEYVLLLNNDTYFIENSVKAVYDYAAGLHQTIIGCKLLNKDMSLQASMFEFPSILNLFTSTTFLYHLFPRTKGLNKYYLFNRKINIVSETDVVIGAFMFCRRADLLSLNGFDERFFFYSEEIDLCYRFKKQGGSVIYYPDTSIVHLGGASAEAVPWFKYKNQITSYIQYYQKHFSRCQFILALSIQYFGIFLRILLSLCLGLLTMKKKPLLASYFYLKQLFVYPKNVFK